MIRIFLADDHTIVREGLRRLIAETPDMEVVGETPRGQEVLQRAATERWDVLVLDLSLEDVSGIEILRRLREQGSTLPVVVLSMYPETQYAVRVLKAGAMAYLSKGCSGDELLDAIRAAAKRRRYVTAATADALVVRDDGHDGAPHTRLSAREHQVFMLVVEGRTPGDIAAELDISPSTVSTHLLHIREKLGVSTNSEMIQYAYRAGLAPE